MNLTENENDGAIRWSKAGDLTWIHLATIPACNRWTDQTDGHDYGYRALNSVS